MGRKRKRSLREQGEKCHCCSVMGLHELSQHRWGIVQQIEAEGGEIERLKALGLCEGRLVELVRAGNPMIIKVLGTRVGLSARLARHISVVECESGAAEGPG